MKFGPVPVAEAEGAILAHSTSVGEKRLRKARRLSAEDVEDLKRAGLKQVVVAVLEADDVVEDDAAAMIASSLAVEGIEVKPPATGRVNLHAEQAGLFLVDKSLIDALNRVDPSITVATLAAHASVERGQMVATVKIIPFAVRRSLVEKAAAVAAANSVALAVRPFRPMQVGLIQTELPSVKQSTLNKTVAVTEGRLARSGGRITAERRTTHRSADVAEALRSLVRESDMVVIFGASAMSDGEDVIPAAIRLAGGTVIRTGMPVDPGNLLVLGKLDGKPVLGAPGCARSPKENGFDWILDRLAAGVEVTDEDIAGLGVGGLLMEIPTRPQPRETMTAARAPRVDIVVLAAGRSTRMGGANKLMALFEGRPLVRRVVEQALASRAGEVVVVTGHQEDRISDALSELGVRRLHNAGYASGLAGSLKTGVRGLSAEADGALVMLGDMPAISAPDLDRLIDAFASAGGRAIARATVSGKRGNPVILPRALFSEIMKLEGDTGARHIVEVGGYPVIDVEIGAAAEVDVDTPEAMRAAGGVLQG